MQTPRRYAPMGGSFAPVRVAGFTWNGWQASAVYAALERCLGSKASRWDQLRLIVDQVARIIIENQEHIVVYQREEKNLDQALSRKVREKRSLFDHRLAEVLTSGHADGEFDIEDPVLTATTIAGMMSWVALWYQPEGRWSEAEIIIHLIRSVERLVCPRALVRAGSAFREMGSP